MSIFDDIQSLEEQVQGVLQSYEQNKQVENFRDAYVDAIINSFDDFSNEELSTVDIDEVVKQAVRDHGGLIDDELRRQINTDVDRIVTDTMDFYNEQGINLPGLAEAIERKDAIDTLKQSFDENINLVRDELMDKTIQSMEDHFAKGNISRASLTDDILEAADGKLAHAKTNARMVVSAYNRIGRDEVRQQAGLKHGYYYGEVRTNSRPFCIRCVGRTFDMNQINRMSNGQGLSVLHYCGGWNCIHSWMWTDPEWDDELKQRYDAERSVVDLEEGGLDLKVPAQE